MGIMVSEVYDALIDAGASEAKARAAAEAVAAVEQLATKQDVADFRAGTKQDMAELRTGTKQDTSRLRQDFSELKVDMVNAVHKILLANLVIAGLLFAALKLFG